MCFLHISLVLFSVADHNRHMSNVRHEFLGCVVHIRIRLPPGAFAAGWAAGGDEGHVPSTEFLADIAPEEVPNVTCA